MTPARYTVAVLTSRITDNTSGEAARPIAVGHGGTPPLQPPTDQQRSEVLRKVNVLCINSPEFAATWQRKRVFESGDNSASAYDMSIATQLVTAGLADEEIANCIYIRREQHAAALPQVDREKTLAKALRPDYVRSTINKARARASLVPGTLAGAGAIETTAGPHDPRPTVRTDSSAAGPPATSVPSGISQAKRDDGASQCTDRANAFRLQETFRDDLILVSGTGFHRWTGTHWDASAAVHYALAMGMQLGGLIELEAGRVEADLTATMGRIARTAYETEEERKKAEVALKPLAALLKGLNDWAKTSESRARVEAALAFVEPLILVNSDMVDADQYLLSVANGTLNLRTGILQPHRRSDLITRAVRVSYDPNATAPMWLAFLRRIFADDLDLIAFVQRALGYALTGDISEQVVFVLYGRGANGKTTLMTVVLSILGPYGRRAMPEVLMSAGKFDRHPTEVADLAGARLVTCAETERDREWAIQRLKDLSGEPHVKARKMRQDPFEFVNAMKVFVSVNQLPRVADESEAFWRRIVVVPFNVTIPYQERDRKLAEKMLQEAPGILAWLVQGCLAWQREGLAPPPAVASAIAAYRGPEDALGEFIDACCELGDQYRAPAGQFAHEYGQWTTLRGKPSMRASHIKAGMESRGYRQVNHGGSQLWRGIRVRSTT